MKNETGKFEGRELKELYFQYWLPEGDPRGYLVAIHDLGGHSDRLEPLAQYFTDKEYGIFSFDLRGHRRNKYDHPGHIDTMDHVQKDIVLFMDIIKERANEKKIFLLGQSFGGLVALIYALNHPGLPGVIVSSPALETYLESILGKKIVKKLTGKLAPTKSIKLNIEQNQLTSDLKILRKYIADKEKLDSITAKTASEINRSVKQVMEGAGKVICPVLIQQATNDKITDAKTAKEFFNRIKSEDKTYKEYEGFLHELWNEKGRAQVFQDMFVWLEKHLK